ncbi:MAG: hypothetical protein ABIT38_04295, partial [Gemmatimonadaceae bacterium]
GRTRREGIEVGVLGATAVAAWFFVVDLLAGHPFFTPFSLGSALQGFFGASAPASMPLTILGYTIFHYIAFIAVGIIFAAIFNAAEREPAVLFGFLILFLGLEMMSLGLTLVLEQSSALRNIAWYQIAAANLVASITMGTYLFRRHRSAIHKAALSLRGI